jgi:predicted RNA-binding protein with PIN domain
MNQYIIDGNNLIGRITELKQLQKRDKQGSREKLVHLLNRYFAGKKVKLSLHFDGFPNFALAVSKGKIFYSEKNSSDHSLMNYGKVNSCTVISADDFYKEIQKSYEKNDEAEKIKQLEKEKDEFLKLFERHTSN